MNGAGEALNESTLPKRLEEPLDKVHALQQAGLVMGPGPGKAAVRSGKVAERTRKPNARATEIVFGALDERLSVMADSPGHDTIHLARIRELLDELKRSLKKQPAQEPEEA